MAYELIKVSELPELTTPSDPNVLPIQDGDYLKRISFENLKEAVTGDVAADLAAEVTAREGAVSGEATARANADTAILADLAAPYDATATYAVGDYCTKDGQLKRCNTEIATAEAWNSAHWDNAELGDDVQTLRSALSLVDTEVFGDVDATFPLTFENGTYYAVSIGDQLEKYYGGGYDLTRKVIKTTTFTPPCKVHITAKTGYGFTVFPSINGVIANVTEMLTEYTMVPNQQYGMTLRTTGGTDDISNVPVGSIIDIEYISTIPEIEIVNTGEFFNNDSWETGYVGATRISTTTSNGDKYNPTPIQVHKGERIIIKLASTTNYLYLYYAWCDKNEAYTQRNGGSSKYTSSDENYKYYETVLIAPNDGYFVMSFRPGNAVYETAGSSVTGEYTKTIFDDLMEDISEINGDILEINSNLEETNAKLGRQFYYQFPSDDGLPIDVCHRGLATVNYPENTIPAFKNCSEESWKWVETDIRLTSDGVWVLLHDSSINRTARNADGTTLSNTVYIADITYQQALEYDFGIYAGQQFAGTKIPTLEEFLNYCNKARLYAVIEVKESTWSQAQMDTAWALVEKYRMQNKCAWLCSSFGGVENILENDQYAPTVATGTSTWEYIAPENYGNNKPTYWLQYKTNVNKMYSAKLLSAFGSKALMDNYVDYCHYWGIYAGVYCPVTTGEIQQLSDRLDMIISQYLKYSDVKANDVN